MSCTHSLASTTSLLLLFDCDELLEELVALPQAPVDALEGLQAVVEAGRMGAVMAPCRTDEARLSSLHGPYELLECSGILEA